MFSGSSLVVMLVAQVAHSCTLGWDCFPSGKIAVVLVGHPEGVKLFHFLQSSFTVDGEKVEERTREER